MGHAQVRRARHAAPVRPRYGRIGAASGAVGITLVAVLGGIGWLPNDDAAMAAARPAGSSPGAVSLSGSTLQAPPEPAPISSRTAGTRSKTPPPTTASAGAEQPAAPSRRADRANLALTALAPLPAASGSGRRVVFDMSSQHVWLVSARDRVRRSYPVSGSVTDNLQPGTYQVYSRSRHAIGVDDSGTMQYFVRFTHGEHAAIGFHDIPVKDGAALQSRAQLGTPQSHGCIRQWRADAKALWRFAPVGTTVVVVA